MLIKRSVKSLAVSLIFVFSGSLAWAEEKKNNSDTQIIDKFLEEGINYQPTAPARIKEIIEQLGENDIIIRRVSDNSGVGNGYSPIDILEELNTDLEQLADQSGAGNGVQSCDIIIDQGLSYVAVKLTEGQCKVITSYYDQVRGEILNAIAKDTGALKDMGLGEFKIIEQNEWILPTYMVTPQFFEEGVPASFIREQN